MDQISPLSNLVQSQIYHQSNNRLK